MSEDLSMTAAQLRRNLLAAMEIEGASIAEVEAKVPGNALLWLLDAASERDQALAKLAAVEGERDDARKLSAVLVEQSQKPARNVLDTCRELFGIADSLPLHDLAWQVIAGYELAARRVESERDQALCELAVVKRERDEALAERDEMAGRYNMEMEIHAESRGETIKAIRDWTAACTERDSALARAEQSEALLREAEESATNWRDTPCIIWSGKKDKGYGYFSMKRKTVRAYRFIYENTIGPVADGLVLDHLCRNPACINPYHLEPVTSAENTLRGIGPTARNSAAERCIHGHALSGENVRIRNVRGRIWRQCRECQRRHAIESKRRKAHLTPKANP